MDGLSSQASLAGYKAVLIAANNLEKFMPMLTTAAGTIRPVAGADHRRGRRRACRPSPPPAAWARSSRRMTCAARPANR